MTDDRILDVIAEAVPYPAYADPARILAALRDGGYEVVPTDTAELGRAVERMDPEKVYYLIDIYVEARVDWR